MKFKPGDLVQINSEMKGYLYYKTWIEFGNRPLKVRTVHETWLSLDHPDDPNSMVSGDSYIFIPWVTNQPLNIEELI